MKAVIPTLFAERTMGRIRPVKLHCFRARDCGFRMMQREFELTFYVMQNSQNSLTMETLMG